MHASLRFWGCQMLWLVKRIGQLDCLDIKCLCDPVVCFIISNATVQFWRFHRILVWFIITLSIFVDLCVLLSLFDWQWLSTRRFELASDPRNRWLSIILWLEGISCLSTLRVVRRLSRNFFLRRMQTRRDRRLIWLHLWAVVSRMDGFLRRIC